MSTEKTEKRDCWDSEDAEVDVPKNIFRSHETWVLYEVTRSTKHFLMVELFCGLIFCSCTAMYIPPSLWDLTLIVFMLVASIIWSAVICMTLVERRAGYLISRNNKKLAEATKEVFSSKQENLVLGWDKVANVLNRKFYIAGDWKTPYCIFDGAKCESYFRRHVLKSMAEEDASEDCEKSCLRAAVDIYRRRVIDQFEWDKYDTPVLADDNFLAGSDHKEFTWRSRNTLKDLHFIVYFVTSLFVLLAGTRSLLLCMIMTILMFATIAARPPLELSTTRSRIRLLATIADVAPREDMDRWDVVARRMNAYLSQDSNSDAGIFFDGKDYLEFFEKQLKPLMSKKIKDYRVATYELVPLIADVVEGPST